MKVLISGEGSWDVGVCSRNQPECEGENFCPGPMTVMVDQIVYQRVDYSLLDFHAICLVSRSCLDELAQKFRPTRRQSISYRGKVYHERQARALGERAKELSKKEKIDVISVLFHDRDGTVGLSQSLWRDKYDAMKRGFRAVEDYELGVPMLPNPKSEAWLLCALKQLPDCSSLEKESGNDASPKSLKKQLEEFLGHPYNNEEMVGKIREGTLDINRIKMDSFLIFREDLNEALNKLYN